MPENSRIFAQNNMGLVENPVNETYYPLVSKRLLDPFAEHLGVLLFSMQERRCKDCGKIKPLSEFEKTAGCYRWVCKECNAERRKRSLRAKREDSSFVEFERQRWRKRYVKSKERGTYKKSSITSFNCAIELKRRGFDVKGKDIHHWNYNQPRSVFILDRYSHSLLHRFMYRDKSTGFCYTADGFKLETAEQAEAYFKKVLLEHGFSTDIQFVDYSNIKTIINKVIRWK